MPTFLDQAVNIFFQNAGGTNFILLIFSAPIIFSIFAPFLRPFDV